MTSSFSQDFSAASSARRLPPGGTNLTGPATRSADVTLARRRLQGIASHERSTTPLVPYPAALTYMDTLVVAFSLSCFSRWDFLAGSRAVIGCNSPLGGVGGNSQLFENLRQVESEGL